MVAKLQEETVVPLPQVGDWLFASCSQEDYGQILKIGKDHNDVDVMDVHVLNPQDLITCEHDEDGDGFFAPLTTIEFPPGDVILRDVQWRMRPSGMIVCNTPGDGCYRCTKLFRLNKQPTKGG